MSTRDLIYAIVEGNALAIEEAFETTMSEKILTRIQEQRVEYAKHLFDSKVEVTNEEIDFAEELINVLSEEELDELDEVLSKDAEAGEWISDFVNSDNPKFKGKSKEKRKQMALAAYYAKQREQ